MVKTAKSTIPSRRHDDRELAAKTTFEPTAMEVSTPQTMVLLLASAEESVLVKALSSLDRYASKMEQNAAALLEEGVLRALGALLSHPDLIIRRFAAKLTSELSFLPAAAQLLLDQLTVTQTLAGLLNNDEDAVVKEFSSSTLAELTHTKRGRDQLLDTQLVHIFCPLLAHPDPDVQKNCLQVMANLLTGDADLSVIVDPPGFSVKTVLDLVTSDYVAIQILALDMLTTLAKDTSLAGQLHQLGAVQRILSILKNYEWKDIHGRCLSLLGGLYSVSRQAEGMVQLFSYMDLIGDVVLRGQAMEAVALACQTPAGVKLVVESGQTAVLGPAVLQTAGPVSTAACHTVAALARDPAALHTLLALCLPSDLLTVLASESRDWNNRGAAAAALHDLMVRDADTCRLVAQSEHKDLFASLLDRAPGSVPVSVAVAAARCVAVLAGHPSPRDTIITPSLVSGLARCFQPREEEDGGPLVVAACDALAGLMCEARARDLLSLSAGDVWRPLLALSPAPAPAPVPVLQAAARLVTVAVAADPSMADALVSLGVLHWLLSQTGLRSECPAWETAIESVFNTFLPIKFALTGRLDLTDTTQHGFYISRRHLYTNQFPILSDVIANNSCPRHLLYVANFDYQPVTPTSTHSKSGTLRPKRSTVTSSQSLQSGSSSYGCGQFRANDEHLLKYIDDVKRMMMENGLSSNIKTGSGGVEDGSTVRRKAALLAQFVARRMSGVERGGPCTTHCLDLHINEIKVELMNSIIPVGCLRAGLHLERAFLFKVLADRIGLAAGLVRGPGGRGWVEVALPVLPPPPRPVLPDRLLRPDHVVDLMGDPGTLYPLGTHQANLYCHTTT